MKKPFTNRILGVNVAVTNMQETVNLILKHINELKGEFICLTNVHTTILAHDSEAYRTIQNAAFLALPDGSPLALVHRLRGYKEAKQVPGPDLMPALWKETAGTEIKHYFYGSTPETIEGLRKNLNQYYPDTKLAGMESPPFRVLSPEEDEEMVKRINASGADIVWVGLGAPKQEEWMYAHQGKINALMIGVGAGFDFHAGTVKRAPSWMRRHYLEWLYRLMQDPERLMKRYVGTNGKFIALSIHDAFVWRKYRDPNRKNLLIYAHYYTPDVASTGQILTELAEGLNDAFHITVICTVPSYTGKISQYYRMHKFYYENINGVDVLRIRVPEFRKNFAPSRIYNIASYFIAAIEATTRLEQQDYVFSISQPPILGGLLGVIAKKLKKAKFIYNIQDFNPEQILAVKYTGNRFVTDIMMKLDKYCCLQADKVIVVGRDMVDTLKKRFTDDDGNIINMPRYCHINNWIDEKEIVPLPKNHPRVEEFKRQYGLNDKYVIMYSGNLGLYYDLENLIKIIGKFKEREDIAFAFIGEGSVKEKLEAYQQKNGLSNVYFIPYQDKADLVYSLNAGDIHLVVNAKGIKGVSVPSKLYGVMAVGKPVFGILEEKSEARLIIEESHCGITATPGNYEAIEKLLCDVIEKRNSKGLSEMGQAGRRYMLEHLTKEVSISKYRDEILRS